MAQNHRAKRCLEFETDFDPGASRLIEIGVLCLKTSSATLLLTPDGLKIKVLKSGIDNGDVLILDDTERFTKYEGCL